MHDLQFTNWRRIIAYVIHVFVVHLSGIQVDIQSPDSLNCLLPSKVANQALKRAFNAQEPEDSLTEEDFALAASLE